MSGATAKPGFQLEEEFTRVLWDGVQGHTEFGEDDEGKFTFWPGCCPHCPGGDVLVRLDGSVSCRGCGASSADAMLSAQTAGEGGGDAAGVVVPLTRNPITTTPLPSKRAADLIRIVDMAEVLSRPEEPIRWAIAEFAQRSALTVLAARGGTGKSWIGMEACAAVQAGRPFLGAAVEQVPALYVDGEMGQRQMAGRFRAAGLAADAFTVADVTGLSLGAADGCAALEQRIAELGAGFIVLDSLRRLTPGLKESDSDDMAPVIGRLAVMAKTLDVALVLIHHAGWSEDRAYRGSTAIGDQADALFSLERNGDAMRLTCNPERGCKMRGAPEPPDRWLQLAIGEQRGVVVVPASAPTATTAVGETAASRMFGELGRLFEGITAPVRKADAAAGLGVAPDNQNFRQAWRRAVSEGLIADTSNGFLLADRVAHTTGTAA